MKARISGRSAAFAVKRAKGWELGRRGRPGLVRVGEIDVTRILGGTPDVIEIDVRTINEVERRLETEWAKDRALRLALILLDPQEPESGLDAIAEALDRLLEGNHVLEHLEAQFHQQEMPANASPDRARAISDRLPRAAALFGGLIDRQATIRLVRLSFEALPDEMFGGADRKHNYREAAIAAGAFRSLVVSSRDGALDDPAVFDLHERLRSLPDARRIVSAWASSFGRTASEPLNLRPDLAELTEDHEEEVADFGGGPGGRQRLRNALEQQAAILERVANGDYDNARRFAQDLVRQQLASAGAPYLAKSLTRLSQKAREMDCSELELEWAYEAAEVQPGDPRSRTQYGDALLHADRIEEALAQYDRAYELGERVYAVSGRARAKRMLGEFEEQLRLYQEARDLAGDGPERMHALIGMSVAHTDLREFDDALRVVDEAIAAFPYEPLPRLSKANSLLFRGCFEDAWTLFDEASQLSTRKVEALNGVAEICLRTGRLDEARRRFSEIANGQPRHIRAHIGLIDTLRALGEHEHAAMYARRIAERFPGSPTALAKHAETASELGRHASARRTLEAAIERFPKNAQLLIARTSAFRREGRYDRALQYSEAAAARFPYNRRFQRIRADMLRRLGQTGLAAEIYRDLSESDPTDVRSRNGLASILIVGGLPQAARKLVENDNPLTRDEWRGFLLLASLMERQGDGDEAQRRLVWAKDNCAFAPERRLFASALAARAARLGKARQAPRIEHTAERDISNLIDFQLAAMTRSSRAKTAYAALTRNLAAPFEPIRDEIARNYRLADGRPRRSKDWITRQLADHLLLAA